MAIEIVDLPMNKMWFSIVFCMFTRGYTRFWSILMQRSWAVEPSSVLAHFEVSSTLPNGDDDMQIQFVGWISGSQTLPMEYHHIQQFHIVKKRYLWIIPWLIESKINKKSPHPLLVHTWPSLGPKAWSSAWTPSPSFCHQASVWAGSLAPSTSSRRELRSSPGHLRRFP